MRSTRVILSYLTLNVRHCSLCNNCNRYVFILLTEMTDPQEIQDEPYLGTFDIILLIALGIGAIYWWFRNNKQEERPPTRSYAIQ